MSHPAPTSTTDTTSPPSPLPHAPPVRILILGLGWTSTFLCPLLETHKITYTGTTRDGRDRSIPFTFDPQDPSLEPFKRLPRADLVIVTFPVRGQEAIEKLVDRYKRTHRFKHEELELQQQQQQQDQRQEDGEGEGQVEEEEAGGGSRTHWLLLGSTGMWKASGWNDEQSPYDKDNERAVAEDRLLNQQGDKAVVLDLAGLWGGQRHPRNWIERVAKTKEEVKGKGALHLVHGEDVARAIVASWEKWERVKGRRWIVTDGWSYDWWGLFVRFAGEGQGGYKEWVYESMREESVRSLPREHKDLGRLVDGRAFWGAVGDIPSTTLT